MDIRVYPTEDLPPERVAALDTYLQGIFTAKKIEDYGPCKDPGGAPLSYIEALVQMSRCCTGTEIP
jgi:hypothetical protein